VETMAKEKGTFNFGNGFVPAAILAVIITPIVVWMVTINSTDSQVERLGAIATFTAAIVGLMGLIVLIVYTKETYLLRKTSERQLEAAERPVLLFGLSSTEFQLAKPLELSEPTIRNIGSGPAFNVAIEPIKGDGVEVQFRLPNVPYIEGNQQLSLKPFITQDGLANGMSEWLSLLADLIRRNKFPNDMIVAVQFDNIYGKTYRSRNRVRYESRAKLVSTVLVPPIEEL
jgi:hypothetical protein